VVLGAVGLVAGEQGLRVSAAEERPQPELLMFLISNRLDLFLVILFGVVEIKVVFIVED